MYQKQKKENLELEKKMKNYQINFQIFDAKSKDAKDKKFDAKTKNDVIDVDDNPKSKDAKDKKVIANPKNDFIDVDANPKSKDAKSKKVIANPKDKNFSVVVDDDNENMKYITFKEQNQLNIIKDLKKENELLKIQNKIQSEIQSKYKKFLFNQKIFIEKIVEEENQCLADQSPSINPMLSFILYYKDEFGISSKLIVDLKDKELLNNFIIFKG
jgi:hypothetical protein